MGVRSRFHDDKVLEMLTCGSVLSEVMMGEVVSFDTYKIE